MQTMKLQTFPPIQGMDRVMTMSHQWVPGRNLDSSSSAWIGTSLSHSLSLSLSLSRSLSFSVYSVPMCLLQRLRLRFFVLLQYTTKLFRQHPAISSSSHSSKFDFALLYGRRRRQVSKMIRKWRDGRVIVPTVDADKYIYAFLKIFDIFGYRARNYMHLQQNGYSPWTLNLAGVTCHRFFAVAARELMLLNKNWWLNA